MAGRLYAFRIVSVLVCLCNTISRKFGKQSLLNVKISGVFISLEYFDLEIFYLINVANNNLLIIGISDINVQYFLVVSSKCYISL